MAKILLLDIETLPNLVYSWGLRVNGEFLDHSNIVQERTILCAAWKWLGEKEICSKVAYNGNDRALVRKLRKLLQKCDAVVAHNGDSFDVKWVRGRMIYHGLPPMKPLTTIDTKKIAKSQFYFNSNRLDYLGKYLGLGQKIKTDFELWKDCMNGDQKAIDKMLDYNIQDIRLLEKVYLKLRPFVPAKFNMALAGGERVCPTCGDAALISRGFGQTRAKKFKRYQCKSCGAWSQKPGPKTGVIR